MPCKAKTRLGKPCRMKCTGDLCIAHTKQCLQSGDGIWDDAKAAVKKVGKAVSKVVEPITRRISVVAQGPRKGPTARFKNFLHETSGHKVVKVELGRKPIVGAVQKALDAMSLGKFTRKSKELNYDRVYHQFLIVTLDNGKKYKVEKNEVVIEQEAKASDYNGKVWDVPLNGKQLTLNDMVSNASKGQEQAFWQYTGGENNCQKFSRDIIERNGLLPGHENEWVSQDAKTLMDTLHPATHPVPNLVTDLAAVIDRGLHGDGVPQLIKFPAKLSCPL